MTVPFSVLKMNLLTADRWCLWCCSWTLRCFARLWAFSPRRLLYDLCQLAQVASYLSSGCRVAALTSTS